MTRSKFATILVLILLMAATTRSVTAQAVFIQSAGSLVLTDEQSKYPLGRSIALLEDPSGTLTIDDVSSPEYDAKFVPSQVDVPNYGYTTSAYWARLDLENRSQQANWLLDVGFPNMFYVDLYTPLPDRSGFVVKHSGVLRPPSARDVPDPNVIFQLVLPSQSRQTIYIRFENGASMTLPLTLWKADAFLKVIVPNYLVIGLFYGILLGLLVYNSFILFSVRDLTYVYLVCFLATFLLWLASYDGLTELFVLKNHYYLKPYYFPVFFVAFWIAIILFCDALLELKIRLPRLHQAMIALIIAWGLLLLLVPFFTYGSITRWMLMCGLLTSAAIIAAGMIRWRQPDLAIRFFMIAAFGFMTGIILTILVRFGFLPSAFFTEHVFRMGVVWLALFWSITLASRINQMKAEAELANRDLQQSEHRLSQILDGMPLGVVLYTKDQKPKYANQSSMDFLTHPKHEVRPDISVGRTLAQAIEYFSFKVAGSHEPYPLTNFPAYRALLGQPAYVDDVEMDTGDRIVPLEVWASPIKSETGQVEAAVVVFEDITLRKQADEELAQYRKTLEILVEKRTTEVNAVNKELRLHLEWLAAVNLVNQMIARSAGFSEVQERIVEIIKHLFASQDAFIAELDLEARQMNILTHSGSTVDRGLNDLSVSLPEKMPSHIEMEPGKPIMMSKDELAFLEGTMQNHVQTTGVQSIAFFPLVVRDKVLGYLGLEMREEVRTLTNEESNLLGIFSTDIAQLIEDARLFEQAKLLVAAEERTRLARELHDSVAQTLYSISLFIDATRLALKTNKSKVVENHLQELTQLSREAMSDMRLLIYELRPPILEKSGLAAALQSRLESVEAKAGFETSFETGGAFHLSPAVESELYRIAQEALNNVIKYAQANRVAIRLLGESGCVRMTIEDDGVGFDPGTVEHGGGQGFRNMRERADNIGAHCSFESVPGRGTKITIEVNE